MKIYTISALFILAIAFNCSGQKITKANNNFEFTKLTFYSGHCFGTCPKIAMNIYNNKAIEVSIDFYIKKGIVDSTWSGNYKGVLKDEEYNKLIGLLQKQDWDTLVFPNEFCCDAPVRTIILSYNGKHKQFSSMFPPEEAREVLKYLTALATGKSLERYAGELVFEPAKKN